VCGVHESLRSVAFQAWQADMETSPQEELVTGLAQIYFRIDGRIPPGGRSSICGLRSP
jgi:hypothetical protein